jgi:hypothetical protein
VAAGNGSVVSTGRGYDDSDSALELSSSLRLLQYFAPRDWRQDNADDRDMSMAPAVLGDGQVLIGGKSRIAYLLEAGHLGGIGGQEARLLTSCGDDMDGGAAFSGSTVYLPCLTGPVAVTVSETPPGLTPLWRAGVGGGPPILAAGLVWTIGQDGTLYGIGLRSGAVVRSAYLGAEANHFPTPSVGAGLLLAPTADGVVAFRATSAVTAPTTSGPTTTGKEPATKASAPTSSPRATVTIPPARRSHSSATLWAPLGVALVVALIGAGILLTTRRRR